MALHRLRVARLLLAGLVLAVVVLTASAAAGDTTTTRAPVGSDARPVAPGSPPTTASWPTPGYSEEELRPVVEALLQLATGASPGPAVASPDPAPSSTPRPTGPGEANPVAGPPRPAEPSPAGPRPGWPVAAVVLGVVGAGGLVVRRALRQRGTKGGHRPAAGHCAVGGEGPAPEPVTTPGIAGRVDLALRHAWATLGPARSAPPSVLAVRVGDLGVEVLLDAPVPDAPGRFVASDDGRTWTLGAEVADDDLRRSVGDQPAPLPGLVTVGTTPEGPVLVDLVHVGTLSVEGDAARVGGFLAGAALELATAPWAAATALGLVGGDDRLGALAGVGTLAPAVSELGRPGGVVGTPTPGIRVRAWLEATSKVAVVVVAPGMSGADETRDIAALVGSCPTGAGLVAPGPIAGATWRLLIAADGQGVLHPLGLELGCAIDTEAVAGTVRALSERSQPARPAGPAGPAGPDVETPPARPGVAVLGPVVVRWPPVAGARRPTRRKLEEVVAYLATHPERPVPAERLRTAIWPLSDDERAGEVADSSFRATMSRTRAALGTGTAGRPYLPEAQDGCYQLDASFGCDWVDFAALVRRARPAPAPEAIGLLGQALALVRGAPFADAPRGGFAWAWSEQLVSVMEVAVADAAERLADLALAAGDPATARWAAERGLLVVPSRESLYRARMRAAFEAGDIDDIDQAYTEVRRAARAVDDAEEPQGETTALYERLRRAARRGPDGDVPADGPRQLAIVP